MSNRIKGKKTQFYLSFTSYKSWNYSMYKCVSCRISLKFADTCFTPILKPVLTGFISPCIDSLQTQYMNESMLYSNIQITKWYLNLGHEGFLILTQDIDTNDIVGSCPKIFSPNCYLDTSSGLLGRDARHHRRRAHFEESIIRK